MGWAEKSNPDSLWNKKRGGSIVSPVSVNVSSPISNSPVVSKVSIPVKQDEPMVMQITPRGVFGLFKDFLCRMLNLDQNQRRSPAPTS